MRVSVTINGPMFWKSLGHIGAKDCQIYLTGIQRLIAGRLQKDELYDARPVSWPPNKDFKPRNIPRGATMFVNVVTMRAGQLGWHFHLPDTYGIDDLRTHGGALVLTLAVTAENAASSSIKIEASIRANRSGFDARIYKG